MTPEPSDQDEEGRSRSMFEQKCGGWVSFLTTVALAVAVLVTAFCQAVPAAECKIEWNANAASEQVTKYLIRVEDFSGEFIATAETPATTYTIPFVPRGTDLIVTLVAVNAKGPSGPAIIAHRYPFKLRLTDQRSTDLKTWTDGHTEEITAETKAFFRQKIESIP